MTDSYRVTPEEWRSIVGLDGYEVSDLGRIRSVDRTVIGKDGVARRFKGRVLAFGKTNKGYLLFHTFRNGSKLVSREVLKAFVGPPPEGMQACHNNGDKTDNSVGNLRWDTQKGNEADKLKHETLIYGERHYAAKLTKAQVEEIRADPRTEAAIAKEYGISPSHAGSVRRGYFRKRG